MDCPPVIFLIFNRPDLTRQVFEKIRDAQPRQLFVVADGPRSGHATDADRCAASRAVIDEVDWPCEVHREFSATNLGCKRRVASGITAAFEKYDRAIILEDDCVPDSSFFEYCTTLLNRYQDEPRVMCISGDNFQEGVTRGDGDYYFSKYPHCWGWATWKRAWDLFDVNIPDWPSWRDSEAFSKICPDGEERQYWSGIFDRCYRDDIDTWDYQWTLCCWMNQGLTAIPNANLVENIGIGPEATHTLSTEIETPVASQLNEFRAASKLELDREADLVTLQSRFVPPASPTPLIKAAIHKLIRLADRTAVLRQFMYFLRLALKPSFRHQRFEERRLNNMPRYTSSETDLPGVNVRFPDAASFCSAYEAIFRQEIYRFDARSRTPLIIDGGANIGLAILYFKQQYPDARIIAFEADPEIFQILQRNVQEWGFENVELHNVALWSEHSRICFESEGADAGRVTADSREAVQVRAVPLEEYLQEPVELLKLDVEGAEQEILQSCRDRLHGVRKLFVEYHSFANQPQELALLMQILESSGFRIIAETENAPPQPFVAQPQVSGIEWALNLFCWRLPE